MLTLSTLAFAGTEEGAEPKTEQVSFSGKVLDDANLEALTGASIRIVELDKVVYADFEGFFSFENIPSGTYTFEVSYVSYSDVVLKDVKVEKTKANKRFFLSTL